ncbi:MAG: hypothetical protein OER87_14870 [Gammaproteobacteria bacterium]|nr:hypothetical protein [Gammaproteobacteria bacterium]
MSIRELTRRAGLNRNTARRYLTGGVAVTWSCKDH